MIARVPEVRRKAFATAEPRRTFLVVDRNCALMDNRAKTGCSTTSRVVARRSMVVEGRIPASRVMVMPVKKKLAIGKIERTENTIPKETKALNVNDL